MNKDLLFDDTLKEKASGEILRLPEDLDLKIKQTVADLPDRKRKKSRFARRGVTAAAVTMAAVIGFSAAFPAYARNIPIVGSVLEFLSEKKVINEEYIEYSSDLNLSKTSNGVTVTINSIIYDGINLSIAYTVESKEEIKDIRGIIGNEFKINGEETGFGGIGMGEFVDKNTYVGIDSYSVAQDYLPEEITKSIVGGDIKIPDTFTADLNIKELSKDLKGNWDFKFKVSREKILEKVKYNKTSIDLSAIRPGLMATEVIFTPVNTVLRTVENTTYSEDKENFIAIDDKGRNLESKGGSGSSSGEKNQSYYQYTFRNIYKDTRSVTFIPFSYTSEFKEKMKNSSGSLEFDKKEVPLNIKEVTTIPQGEAGEYKITKVELLKEKTLIYYECTRLPGISYPYNLAIIDSEGNEYEFNREAVKKEGDNKFIAEIEPLSKEGEYKVRAIDLEKVYDVKEDLKFTVEVK